MVLNRSEEKVYHYIVKLLGKLIEMPIRTSEILPLLRIPPGRVGKSFVLINFYLLRRVSSA